MKLSEMRQTLNQRGLQLTRSLGQSFLHDGNQIRRILNRRSSGREISSGSGREIQRAGECRQYASN